MLSRHKCPTFFFFSSELILNKWRCRYIRVENIINFMLTEMEWWKEWTFYSPVNGVLLSRNWTAITAWRRRRILSATDPKFDSASSAARRDTWGSDVKDRYGGCKTRWSRGTAGLSSVEPPRSRNRVLNSDADEIQTSPVKSSVAVRHERGRRE